MSQQVAKHISYQCENAKWQLMCTQQAANTPYISDKMCVILSSFINHSSTITNLCTFTTTTTYTINYEIMNINSTALIKQYEAIALL